MNAREFIELQDAYQGVYESYLEPNFQKREENNKKAIEDMKKTKAHKDMVATARKKFDEEVETDVFTQVLEYLVAEGYADTNENALAIMANMSEEWKQSIVEEEKPYPEEKVNAKIQKVKKKEEIAIHQRNPQEADKQYKRSIALRFKKKMSDIGRG
jgi:hypothetical protein